MKYIDKENYKNQKEIILSHLKRYGSITTIEGYQKYKIMRTGSVINMLRKEGYEIETIMEKSKRLNTRYAKYFLKEGD